LPLHSTTRLIWSSGTSWMLVAPGTTSAWSRSTRWKEVPGSMSVRKLVHFLLRNSDLGVSTISGFLKLRCICRRRMWK